MSRSTLIFGEKIAKARDALHMTQGRLGELIEPPMSDEGIGRIERLAVAGILTKKIPSLAAALKIPLARFERDFIVPESTRFNDNGTTAEPKVVSGFLPATRRDFDPGKLLGIVAAGEPRETDQAGDDERPEAGAFFTVKVEGESMTPPYLDGSRVAFSREQHLADSTIVDGKDYIVTFADDTSTFKQVFADKKNRQYLVLRPRNANRKLYPERRVHRDQIKSVARVAFIPPP
jgi:SOS-response transcriptional repressor LexA